MGAGKWGFSSKYWQVETCRLIKSAYSLASKAYSSRKSEARVAPGLLAFLVDQLFSKDRRAHQVKLATNQLISNSRVDEREFVPIIFIHHG